MARATTSLDAWWASDADLVLRQLGSGAGGLDDDEAARRLDRDGANELRATERVTRLGVLVHQLKNPLLLLLAFAAGASLLTGAWVDAAIVAAIFAASTAIGYSREYVAARAAAALRSRVLVRATVVRGGVTRQIPARELVVGDVVLLSAGSIVPADLRLIDTTDCHVNQAALTGESYPVEKDPAPVARDAPLAARDDAAYLGSDVRSGTARGVVVATGTATAFGDIALRLAARPPETEFDRSLRHFGYLLTVAMLVVAFVVFAVNVVLGRPPIATLLFAIALAVGLAPELLPAILQVNLARGAQLMAARGVLVRRLGAIENLGSMDVLCTDKTGTLTEGVVRLDEAYDPAGAPSPAVRALAAANACLQAGMANPLDEAIRAAAGGPAPGVEKVGEVPYDFQRKRLSVIVRDGDAVSLIAKGAFDSIVGCCATVGGAALDDAAEHALRERYRAWAGSGVRVLGVATRRLAGDGPFGRDDERGLDFAGFLTFVDRPKPDAGDAVRDLAELGVAVKVITGDSELVAGHVARAVGLPAPRILTGRELDRLQGMALARAAAETDLFAEVDPDQKERIVRALRQGGHVVGFMGDGINDAPAMHAADASLSVDGAVDVAKAAADFVLLERDLHVIRRGVEEGRRTFANTLKYVLTTMSANLGNMLSMALASLVLPFLPMLAGQILLNNLLSDIPAIGLAGDRVDAEAVARPRRWSMKFITRFMVEFGALSSCFDVFTFALLWWPFAATAARFRTGWFVESLVTELVIALVVRTTRPMWTSRPGRALLISTLVLVPVTFAIPFVPGAGVLGFEPLPAGLVAALVGVTVGYVAAAELLKRWFFRVRAPAH